MVDKIQNIYLLISWFLHGRLHTHAVIEPFVIATHRQLSAMHPIHKLLSPHFRDTMKMNNMARHGLINANGIIERNFFPGSFAMKMSSNIYRKWNLMDHALPTDLIKRFAYFQLFN